VLNDPAYEDGAIVLRQVSIFFGENYVLVGRVVQHDEALALVEVELAARVGVETRPPAPTDAG